MSILARIRPPASFEALTQNIGGSTFIVSATLLAFVSATVYLSYKTALQK